MKNEEWFLDSKSNGKTVSKKMRNENFDIIEKIASRTLDTSFLPAKNKSKKVIQLNPTNLEVSQVTMSIPARKS